MEVENQLNAKNKKLRLLTLNLNRRELANASFEARR